MRGALAWVVASLAAGCVGGSPCPPARLRALSDDARFVVVRSDYVSSALAILDGDAEVLEDDWVDSGTRVASLVTGLSGDVVVPSTRIGGVAWLDRFAVDVLTLAGRDGTIAAQIDLRGERDRFTGFSSNPHDALRLADGRILVSRHNPNPDRSAPVLQLGNDVVVIEDGAIIARIDLGADLGVAFARPDALVPLRRGERSAVLVTLTRLSGDFMEAAPGGALLLDAALTPSTAVDFGPLENCFSASADPGDPSRAYVLCTGLFSTEAERRAHAGVVELTLSETGSLEITSTFTAGAGASPVPSNGLVALGSGRVLAIAWGTLVPPTPDRLLLIDVPANTAREVLRTSGAAFVLGEGTFDAVHGVALIPDAESRSVLRIDAASGTLADRVPLGGCLRLPPREIAPI